MTRSVLASSDTAATLKIMAFKVCLVIVSSALNGLGKPQAVFMLIFALAAVHHQSWQVSLTIALHFSRWNAPNNQYPDDRSILLKLAIYCFCFHAVSVCAILLHRLGRYQLCGGVFWYDI